ncbi:uncharacterized protein LOC117818041 [Notolabrus celidotus]|uniref:uncharacterized protein LOC117818041 n=1 Tax=Notolabrus celidotus TaxID=1203425 RepID=UPI00148FF6AF|nr:uncharacterized protein LOC117818041 [Notolabrus celidotus]
MIVFWITLLLFHQAYPLIPVKTVQVGEPVTLTCVTSGESTEIIYWFKQSAGETLKLIVTLNTFGMPNYEPEFSASRFDANIHKNMSNLTIFRTTQEDEGIYHCGVLVWKVPTWSSTYLSLTGHPPRTSNLTVVQSSTVSDPVRPGDSMTLQCSVLSDSENKTCPGGHSVYWFRAGSNKSHPDIIYTDENRRGECEQRSDTQKSCVYHLSKSVSSSDAGTYYCAVATCGQILFGDGTKVEIVKTHPEWIAMGILIVCLFISVVGNVVLLCKQKVLQQLKGLESEISEAQADSACLQTGADDELNYAALNFSAKKSRGRKKRELVEDGVYAQVRC